MFKQRILIIKLKEEKPCVNKNLFVVFLCLKIKEKNELKNLKKIYYYKFSLYFHLSGKLQKKRKKNSKNHNRNVKNKLVVNFLFETKKSGKTAKTHFWKNSF